MDSIKEALRSLGLSEGVSWEAINQAYRDLVRVWHPDRFQADPRLREKAEQHTRVLNSAIKTLRDEYSPETASSSPPNSKAASQTSGPKSPRVRKKTRGNTSSDFWDDRPAYRKTDYILAPLLLYPRRFRSLLKVAGSLALTAAGLHMFDTWNTDQYKMAAGCVASLAALNLGIKHFCLLVIRRPLLRVDQSGLRSFDEGALAWSDLNRVWSFTQASTPALAIECTNQYLKQQPIFRRALLRVRHLFRRAHIIVSCGGLDRHPHDVVRALEAQHLIGSAQPPQLTRPDDKFGVPWCRVIAIASALSVVVRSALGLDLTMWELGVYFVVFTLCQASDMAMRLLQVPSKPFISASAKK